MLGTEALWVLDAWLSRCTYQKSPRWPSQFVGLVPKWWLSRWWVGTRVVESGMDLFRTSCLSVARKDGQVGRSGMGKNVYSRGLF